MNAGFSRGLSPPPRSLPGTHAAPRRSGSNKLQSLLHGQPLAEVFFHLRFMVRLIISACCCQGFPQIAWGRDARGAGGTNTPPPQPPASQLCPPQSKGEDGANCGLAVHGQIGGTARIYPVIESIGGRWEAEGGRCLPWSPPGPPRLSRFPTGQDQAMPLSSRLWGCFGSSFWSM